MKNLLYCIIIFVVIYLFYLVFVIKRKNVLKKMPEGKEMRYLKYKYNIKITDKNLLLVAHLVSLANSFILSTSVFVVCLFDNLFLEILVGFVTLIILIIIVYHILGVILCKKEGK